MRTKNDIFMIDFCCLNVSRSSLIHLTRTKTRNIVNMSLLFLILNNYTIMHVPVTNYHAKFKI